MTLEPRIRAIVRLAGLAGGDDLSVPMPIRRERSARMSRMGAWLVMAKGPDPADTVDRLVPVDGGEIMVRLYVPHGPGPHPLYVFFHGGGWCMGTLQERDARCRAVSAGARCVVASVDYRMAPENQYPTAPEDCYAAVRWLVAHAHEIDVDAGRVAVGGESAGANLAAVVSLMARDRGGPRLCHQWLDVPATDATLAQSGHREVPDGYMLDAEAIDDFLRHYLRDPAQAAEPLCSPLLAADHHGLAPAWIMTAEFDKLRGDGEAYAAALAAAGVPVRHVRLAGHVHASFAFTRIGPSAADYERDAIAALASAFRD